MTHSLVLFWEDWLWTRFMDITDCTGVLSLWDTREGELRNSANQLPTTCKRYRDAWKCQKATRYMI
jgi:hypothetical protein